ncbi:MAG TPA: hypothetical protein VE870_08895 [Bacteroidales bacterium]|nr:hypothetical protein [Bacteroidales bacterium]
MEDFLYKFLSLYNRMPLPMRQFLGYLYRLIPERIRYGSFYSEYLNRLDYFGRLNDLSQVAAEQEKLLRAQVNHAIDKIPYYKNYERLNTAGDLSKYPVISKQTIIDHYNDFIRPGSEKERIRANTGGSSGTPLAFYLHKGVSRPKEKAHFKWYWGQYGYKPGSRMLMVRGNPLQNNRTFEHRTIDNILNVSCYNINEDTIQPVLNRINAVKPWFIHAYPSSLKVLTTLLEPLKSRVKFKPRALFLGSEHLPDNDRKLFADFYQAPVVNWYGHSEALVHGGNCPYSDEYHFYPAYGYLELLDDNGQPVTTPGSEGRLVATGFDNRVMPLIRYDTGDTGILSDTKECRCGFRGPSLTKITGRGQDYVVLSDNTRVSLTAFIFGQHLEAFRRIREMQVIQNKKGKLEICIVKNHDYTINDEDKLVDTLTNSVNGKIEVSVSYIDTVPKTPRGKNIFFVTKL